MLSFVRHHSLQRRFRFAISPSPAEGSISPGTRYSVSHADSTGSSRRGYMLQIWNWQGPSSCWIHPATGGNWLNACPGDMLLEALVACAGVTLNAVATALNIELRDASLQAESDLDYRCKRRTINNNTPPDGAVLCCLPNANSPHSNDCHPTGIQDMRRLYSLKLSGLLIYSSTGYGTLWNGTVSFWFVICAWCCQCP